MKGGTRGFGGIRRTQNGRQRIEKIVRNHENSRAEKWSKNGRKMGLKIDPKIGPKIDIRGPKHLLTRPVFEKWPKNGLRKMGRKSCFRGRKMAEKWVEKWVQKSTQNRGRKWPPKPKLRLKSKNGPKIRLEKWAEKWVKKWPKKWSKNGSKNNPKIDKIEGRKTGIFGTKPKLRLKSKKWGEIFTRKMSGKSEKMGRKTGYSKPDIWSETTVLGTLSGDV